jgi:hypothetical protein
MNGGVWRAPQHTRTAVRFARLCQVSNHDD